MTLRSMLPNISEDVENLNPELAGSDKPKRAKYLNNPKVYNGREYKSEWEADIACDLDLELYAGAHVAVIAQVTIPLRDGIRMILDWVTIEPDATWTAVEAKGPTTRTRVYRNNRKMFKAMYPNVKFREILKPDWRVK